MLLRRKRSRFSDPPKEPLFIAIAKDDPDMLRAYERAGLTVSNFQARVLMPGNHLSCVKLRFRDPELSERLGEDRFVFLWLSCVQYHADQCLYSGVFAQLPKELTWLSVGEQLTFAPDQIFDWMVNDDGHLHGGFTMRVAREHLPEVERQAYDTYVGVSVWEPLPDNSTSP